AQLLLAMHLPLPSLPLYKEIYLTSLFYLTTVRKKVRLRHGLKAMRPKFFEWQFFIVNEYTIPIFVKQPNTLFIIMKKIALLLALCTILFFGCSKDDNQLPELPKLPDLPILDDVCSAMEDPIFINYCYANFDSDKNGKISAEEANKVNYIAFYDTDLISLKGIEYFPNLTTLVCANTNLKKLDVTRCSALIKLYCLDNNLTTLDVTRCPALTDLCCQNNDLETLDLSRCPALVKLICINNNLSILDVTRCVAMKVLYCWNNKLTKLILGKNIYLTDLLCYENNLTTLDVSGCKVLKYFSCAHNNLSKLVVSNCLELSSLNCNNNNLIKLDVRNCAVLTEISCISNPNLTALWLKPGQKIPSINKDANTTIYYKD
ncbi:MAG: hypothetical protein PHV09_05155, partial [Bacteroidales bacterium]|nr:hypothetical protein [Bacteroidales bacterium]